MVKILSANERLALEQAVLGAEARTSADIVTLIASASDGYLDFRLLYGFIASDFIVLSLHASRVLTDFSLLLAVQLAVVILGCLPFMRRVFCRLVPQAVRRKRSFRNALDEFNIMQKTLPANAPAIMLFVSLAERYAHVMSSPALSQKYDNVHWNRIIADFTATISAEGLAPACTYAIQAIGTTLAVHFPPTGLPHVLGDEVIERG